MRIYTVGHGARPYEELVETLASGAVEQVVDVRSFPGSRHNPQFGKEVLAEALRGSGLLYVWLPALGGRRRPGLEPSPNPSWQVEAFRSYADYMDTPEFAAGIAELCRLGETVPSAYMCSETHWSRCHRRLISDKLVVLGHEVIHLITPTRAEPHRLTAFARVTGDRIRYDR